MTNTTDLKHNELTPEQMKWWRRFKKCLADMPTGIEIHVHVGCVAIAEDGSREAAFMEHGNVDNMSEFGCFFPKRIYACESTL